jgi:hypothetical protein
MGCVFPCTDEAYLMDRHTCAQACPHLPGADRAARGVSVGAGVGGGRRAGEHGGRRWLPASLGALRGAADGAAWRTLGAAARVCGAVAQPPEPHLSGTLTPTLPWECARVEPAYGGRWLRRARHAPQARPSSALLRLLTCSRANSERRQTHDISACDRRPGLFRTSVFTSSPGEASNCPSRPCQLHTLTTVFAT